MMDLMEMKMFISVPCIFTSVYRYNISTTIDSMRGKRDCSKKLESKEVSLFVSAKLRLQALSSVRIGI